MSEAIKDITFLMSGSSDLKAPEGYIKINNDLNEGAGGKYIYLCYTKLGENSPITGLYLIEGDEQTPAGYYRCPIDLNQGAGGAYIFLCWTTSSTAGAPITDICFVKGEGTAAPEGYQKLDLDLNKGAGGQYIYLCYKR